MPGFIGEGSSERSRAVHGLLRRHAPEVGEILALLSTKREGIVRQNLITVLQFASIRFVPKEDPHGELDCIEGQERKARYLRPRVS